MFNLKKTAMLFSLAVSASLFFAGSVPATPDALNDRYAIDHSKSTVIWTAKSVRGGHFGKVKISEGTFQYNGRAITSGNVTINMNSISVDDLEEASRKERLEGHLKNDDFFAADKFPEAKLVITGSKPGSKAGELEVSGNLTIKGITNPVTFPATVKTQGNQVEAEGTITVDRILYDIKYRSKSVLDPSALANRLIHDEFTLNFKVIAGR